MENIRKLRYDVSESLRELEKTRKDIEGHFEELVSEAKLNSINNIFDESANGPKYYKNLLATKEHIQRLQHKFDRVKHYLINEDDISEESVPEELPLISTTPAVDFNIPIASELTHFKSFSDFWVEHGDEELQALSLLLENFNMQPKGELRPGALRKGSYCMATLPPENLWHRARVDSLTTGIKDSEASLHFVDFGKVAVRPVNQLLPMPQELREYPPQAIHCRLKDASQILHKKNKEGADKINKLLKLCLGMTGIYVTFHPPHAPGEPFPVEVSLKPTLEGEEWNYNLSFKNLQEIIEDTILLTACDNYCRKLGNLIRIVQLSEGSQERGEPEESLNCTQFLSTSTQFLSNSTQFHSTSTRRNSAASSLPSQDLNLSRIIPSSTAQQPVRDINTPQPSSSSSFQENPIGAPNMFPMSSPQPPSLKSKKPANTAPVRPNSHLSERKIVNVSGEPMAASSQVKERGMLQNAPVADSNLENPEPDSSFIDIPEATFPQKSLGEKFLLKLTAVGKEPGEVYIALPSVEKKKEEDDIQKTLNAHNWGDEIYEDIQVKTNSCWVIRRRDLWHRVRVVGVGKTPDEVMVQLVDKGCQDKVRKRELKPLPPQLASIPSHAHLCLLNHFTPDLAEDKGVQKYLHQSTSASSLYTGVLLAKQLGYLPVLDQVVSVTESNGPTLVDILKTKIKTNGAAAASKSETPCVNNKQNDGQEPGKVNNLPPPPIPTTQTKEPVEELEEWDPLKSDFTKPTNSYDIPTDDPEMAVVGYKSKEERYLCKFFANKGQCNRERCPYMHIPLKRTDMPTQDITSTYELDCPLMTFPEEGSILYAMVSSVASPGQFSLVFPFGTQDEISGYHLNDKHSTTDNLKELMEHMKKFYSKSKPMVLDGVLPAIGNLMVCGDKFGEWYRCKLLEVNSHNAKVSLIDFGSTEVFPLSSLRQIEKDFIFMPPQCLPCQLAGVAPLQDKGWDTAASTRFEKMVSKIMLAVTFIDCSSLPLTVTLHPMSGPPRSIGDRLLEEKLAQSCSVLPGCNNNFFLPG